MSLRTANTFSLATLMVAMTVVAVMLFVSGLGYWPSVAMLTITGALVAATVPASTPGSLRYKFVIYGVFGALLGCWLGAVAVSVVMQQPVEKTGLQEELVCIVVVLCACFTGAMTGSILHLIATSSDESQAMDP